MTEDTKTCKRCSGRGLIYWHPYWDNGYDFCKQCGGWGKVKIDKPAAKSAQPDRLPAFLMNLECLDAHGQQDAFLNEVMETFGRFDPPAGDRTHRWELDLHGISADGATEEEAMANWKRLARQHCKLDGTEDDGFITVHPPVKQIGAA